jgi:hypothetical protein
VVQQRRVAKGSPRSTVERQTNDYITTKHKNGILIVGMSSDHENNHYSFGENKSTPFGSIDDRRPHVGEEGGNNGGSPNRKKDKNLPQKTRFFLHDDRKGVKTPLTKPIGQISVPVVAENEWKHDKFDEMRTAHSSQNRVPLTPPQKSPSSPSPAPSIIKENLIPDSSTVNAPSAIECTKGLNPDPTPSNQKSSRKKKKNSNGAQVVDQTTVPPQVTFTDPALPIEVVVLNEKKTEKGKNKSQQMTTKNKQDADQKNEPSVKSSQGKGKLEVIPPAAPTPEISSIIPAAVPVPFPAANAGQGTVDDAPGISKSKNRRNRKARQANLEAATSLTQSQTEVQLQPPILTEINPPTPPQAIKTMSRTVPIVQDSELNAQATKSQSRTIQMIHDIELNAPPPPPPSPMVGSRSHAPFDCDDELIAELSKNITATLRFGEVPKKRKRNKKKKHSDQLFEDDCGQGMSDDDSGDTLIHFVIGASGSAGRAARESENLSDNEDFVEEIEQQIVQESSKSSKKKKNKKKNDENAMGNSVSPIPQNQTEKKQLPEETLEKIPPGGNKLKTPQNASSVVESKGGSGSMPMKGSGENKEICSVANPFVTMNAPTSVGEESLPVVKEGKKRRRSRKKKKNKGLNEIDDPDGGPESGDEAPELEIEGNEMAPTTTHPVIPDPAPSGLSYEMFEANRNSLILDDVDVPPGFEPTLEDTISSFLPSSLSATTIMNDSDPLDSVTKSIDDLVAESLSSLSRLNLDDTIGALDLPLDFETEFRQPFSLDDFFGMSPSGSLSQPLRSSPISRSEFANPPILGPRYPAPESNTHHRLKADAPEWKPPTRAFSRALKGVDPRADRMGPRPPQYFDPRTEYSGNHHHKYPMDNRFPSRGANDYISRPVPGPPVRPSVRYPYDDMKGMDQFAGMSPEDVIISRLPARRGEQLGYASRGPPPPSVRSRLLYASGPSREREVYFREIDEYNPSPSVPQLPPSYPNAGPYPPSVRPPPRLEGGLRGGVPRYPLANPPVIPEVEKFIPSGSPVELDSGPALGINFTLASQQPRNHFPNHPPPSSHPHW